MLDFRDAAAAARAAALTTLNPGGGSGGGLGGVRRRFRELSVLVHPDKCSAPEAEKARSQQALSVLVHPGKCGAPVAGGAHLHRRLCHVRHCCIQWWRLALRKTCHSYM